MNKKDKIDNTLADYADALDALSDNYIGESIGVHQAIGDIRAALDDIEIKMASRYYEQAAALGYREIASSFIFLQRALGGLQSVEGKKHSLIAEIGIKSGVPVYEEIAPHVTAAISALNPKGED